MLAIRTPPVICPGFPRQAVFLPLYRKWSGPARHNLQFIFVKQAEPACKGLLISAPMLYNDENTPLYDLGGHDALKTEKTHTHLSSDGTEYTHSHDSQPEHTHSHQNTKSILDRLSRASGHLNSVRRMVEDGRDCSEVLIQLSAVIAALNNTGKVILKDHLDHCIVEAVESGDHQAIENLNKAIDSFIK